MTKKALHIEQVQATKDELQLAVERVMRPLAELITAEMKELRVAVATSGKSKFLTIGQIKKEYGLPKSAVLKFQNHGQLTAYYLNPVRYEREQIEKLIHSKKLVVHKMSAV